MIKVFTANLTDWEQIERIGPDAKLPENRWVLHLRKVHRRGRYGGHQGVYRGSRVHTCGDEKVTGSGWTSEEKHRGKRNSVSARGSVESCSHVLIQFGL